MTKGRKPYSERECGETRGDNRNLAAIKFKSHIYTYNIKYFRSSSAHRPLEHRDGVDFIRVLRTALAASLNNRPA